MDSWLEQRVKDCSDILFEERRKDLAKSLTATAEFTELFGVTTKH